MLFVQMVGRGLRTSPDTGKADCLILDHSDNHLRLGFVTDIHHDQLDDGKPRAKAVAKPSEALPQKCPKCAFLKPPKVSACPCCGFLPVRQNKITNRAGELVEMVNRTTVKATTPADREAFLGELKWIGRSRGYKPGWPAVQFKEKYGFWPDAYRDAAPRAPSTATSNWVQSQLIRYAKARQRRTAS